MLYIRSEISKPFPNKKSSITQLICYFFYYYAKLKQNCRPHQAKYLNFNILNQFHNKVCAYLEILNQRCSVKINTANFWKINTKKPPIEVSFDYFANLLKKNSKVLSKINFIVPFYVWDSTASRLPSRYEEAVHFLQLSCQIFQVLLWSNSIWWKSKSTLEPPSDFEPLDWNFRHNRKS